MFKHRESVSSLNTIGILESNIYLLKYLCAHSLDSTCIIKKRGSEIIVRLLQKYIHKTYIVTNVNSNQVMGILTCISLQLQHILVLPECPTMVL